MVLKILLLLLIMDNMGFSIGEIVNIKRHENKGDANRIPHSYRSYVTENNYMYKGVIINLGINKDYFRVRPLPINDNDILTKCSTRKATKTKTYKLDM